MKTAPYSVWSKLAAGNRSAEFLEKHAGNLFAGDMRDPELRAQHIPAMARDVDQISLNAQLMACMIWGTWDMNRLGGWEQPTLLIASDDDPITPVENSREAYAKMDNIVTYHEEENGGHLFLHTRAERAQKIIDGFRASEQPLLQLAA